MLRGFYKTLLLLFLVLVFTAPLYGITRRPKKVFSVHKTGGFLSIAPITTLKVEVGNKVQSISGSLSSPGLFYEWIPYYHVGFGVGGNYFIRSFQASLTDTTEALSLLEQGFNFDGYVTYYFKSYRRAVGFKPYASFIIASTTFHSSAETYGSTKTIVNGITHIKETGAGKGATSYSVISYSLEGGTDWVNRKAGLTMSLGYQIIPQKTKDVKLTGSDSETLKFTYKYSNIYIKISVFTLF